MKADSVISRRSALLAGLSGLSALACNRSSAPGAAATTKVKLALNWVPEPEFGGFYAAKEIGAFAKESLEVDILGGGVGAPVLQMVASGQADFGISGADEILVGRSKGADVLPIYAVFQTNPQAIMAHASRGARSVAELLSSGTIALEPGLPYAAFLKKKYGFDKVKIVPYDGGVARFVSDKNFAQQCFIGAEPVAAKKKGAEPAVFMLSDEGFNPYSAIVIASQKTWSEHPERVRAFRRAIKAGWRAYLDDPAKANVTMGKLNSAMDAETFAASAKAQAPLIETAEAKQNGLGSMLPGRWQTIGKQLVELSLLDKEPNVELLLAAAKES